MVKHCIIARLSLVTMAVLSSATNAIVANGQKTFPEADQSYSTGSNPGAPPQVFDPVSETCDWQAQDFEDSQAISDVVYDPARRMLMATGKFEGGSRTNEKGEVYLDLRFVPDLEGKVPLDLSNTTIQVEVVVSGKFNHRLTPGVREIANGIQIFGKDNHWRSQYSTWKNTLANRNSDTTYRLSHRFIRGLPREGWSDTGFDPAKIQVLGVKFGLGVGSKHGYEGHLFIKSIRFDPPIAAASHRSRKAMPDIFTPQSEISLKGGAFFLNSKKWFVIGGNWRGLEYGQNWGTPLWWPRGNGVLKHINYFKHHLKIFQSAGIKILRVGLVKDGRVALSPAGEVTGYNEAFKADLRKFLDLADSHDMRVELTLVDYLIAGTPQMEKGVQLRGRQRLIADSNLRRRFLEKFLRPFLIDFADHPAWISTDIINESEWLISEKEGGGWDEFSDKKLLPPDPIPLASLHSFITECIKVIKSERPDMLVTVGVSSKYAGLVKGLPVDYYALHHYPNFGDLKQYLKHIPPGIPWILEEYPTADTELSPAEYMNMVKEMGGSGALLWNLRPDSDNYTYRFSDRDVIFAEIKGWALANRFLVFP
jgi:hypothetical protein